MTTGPLGANRPEPTDDGPVQFRYGIVLLLTLGVVVFVIAAPSANWSRATALAIDGVALVFAIATTRDREAIRRRNAAITCMTMIALVLLAATGAAPRDLIAIADVLITAAIPVVIVGGLLRLMRERGVTLQAVAGALTIYLSRPAVRLDHRVHHTHRLDSLLRAARRRHAGRPALLQLYRADNDRFRRLLRRHADRPRPRGHRNADRPALPGYGHRPAGRQLRGQTEDLMNGY